MFRKTIAKGINNSLPLRETILPGKYSLKTFSLYVTTYKFSNIVIASPISIVSPLTLAVKIYGFKPNFNTVSSETIPTSLASAGTDIISLSWRSNLSGTTVSPKGSLSLANLSPLNMPISLSLYFLLPI